MMRREDFHGDEAVTAEGWAIGDDDGGYTFPLPIITHMTRAGDSERLYDTDGTLSESGSSSSASSRGGLYRSGSRSGEMEGGVYSDFTPEAWVDSGILPSVQNEYGGHADAEEQPAAWDTDYYMYSSMDDGTETSSWSGDNSLFDGDLPLHAKGVLPAGLSTGPFKVEASSLHEPPRSELLARSQDLPMSTNPAKTVATVNGKTKLGQQSVAKKTKSKSPGICPLCSRAAYCDVEDATQLSLDTTTPLNGKGRCKARDKPRKDNRLGLWYRKYGYDGPPYCKGCSESFKSHLIQQKTRPRCGCVRASPCLDCTKVLDGFSGMLPRDVFDKFDANKSSRARAPVKKSVRKATGISEYSDADPPKRQRKAPAVAGLAAVLIGAIMLCSRSAVTNFEQTPSADSRATRCVDDEEARVAANPFSDPQKPFSMSCHELALNGQCDLEGFVNLGVREFCCDSCNAVEPVWICPAAVTDVVGQEITLDKAPAIEIPANQAFGAELAATYQFCSAAPFSKTVPCSFMSTDETSDQLCFACTGAQALLHGASCEGEDHQIGGTIPYGWTCRCDGCIAANSGDCVTSEFMQQDIYDFERLMGADSSDAGTVDLPPTVMQPGSIDPAHGGGAVGPAFTHGGIEAPQGEIKMPDGSTAMGYTTEQQARLHVDVFGNKPGSPKSIGDTCGPLAAL